MEAMVTTVDDADAQQTYVGITVCKGPGRHRLLLTRPYHEAGRIVEIPRSEIRSIEPFDGS